MKLREIQVLGSSSYSCEKAGCDAPAKYRLIFARYTQWGQSEPFYDRCTVHAQQMAQRYGAQLPALP